MCGIVGGIWNEEVTGLDKKIETVLDCLKHRGPDDNGYEKICLEKKQIILAHTRLSIIDLSNAGHQPMSTEDGRFTIVFNGEIYNYLELRKELEASGLNFQGNSDTEVLLKAWSIWGQDTLLKLDGMFAFVIVDKLHDTLTCARDAFGVKPLFYKQDDGSFLFSSELPSLLALDAGKKEPNLQKAYDYLVFGEYDSGKETFIKGVNQLEPAQIFITQLSDPDCYTLKTWWKPENIQQIDISFEEAAERVRSEFLTNMKLQLRSDVPLGVALSGGIDSSAVVCAMRRLIPDSDIHTFSYVAKGSEVSEEKWIDIINKSVGAKPHKIIVSGKELTRDLKNMILAQGEPFGSTSIYAQYRIFKHIKKAGITVNLDGQGADELLAGYDGYPGQRVLSLIERFKLLAAIKFSIKWAQWPNRKLGFLLLSLGQIVLPDFLYQAFRSLSGKTASPKWLNSDILENNKVVFRENRLHSRQGEKGRRVIGGLKYNLGRRNLPALLRHADRNSMAFSVENRVPFLSIRLAELLLSLPEEYLISNAGQTKSVFREAMQDIVPETVLQRKDKIGFATPEKDWMFEMAAEMKEWVGHCKNIPFINHNEVLREFETVIDGKGKFTWQLWRWINYSIWYKSFIESDGIE